jgi:hypothetical protein
MGALSTTAAAASDSGAGSELAPTISGCATDVIIIG